MYDVVLSIAISCLSRGWQRCAILTMRLSLPLDLISQSTYRRICPRVITSLRVGKRVHIQCWCIVSSIDVVVPAILRCIGPQLTCKNLQLFHSVKMAASCVYSLLVSFLQDLLKEHIIQGLCNSVEPVTTSVPGILSTRLYLSRHIAEPSQSIPQILAYDANESWHEGCQEI